LNNNTNNLYPVFKTDTDTIIKPASVPIFTNSTIAVMGRNAAKYAASSPKIIMPLIGVLNI
jgi:hypothetical protein